MYFLIPLVAAIAPFVIWPIELLLPYPYIVEEAVKALLVLFILDCTRISLRIKTVLASALLFTLSETVLYILNISLVGNLSTLLIRFGLTFILHSLTMLIIFFSAYKTKWLMPIGIVAAMLIHYFYNLEINILFGYPT